MYGGVAIYENPNLTKKVQSSRRLSLWQRLTSLYDEFPYWKPWIKSVLETETVPDDTIYRIGATLHMHPRVAAQMRKEITEDCL